MKITGGYGNKEIERKGKRKRAFKSSYRYEVREEFMKTESFQLRIDETEIYHLLIFGSRRFLFLLFVKTAASV